MKSLLFQHWLAVNLKKLKRLEEDLKNLNRIFDIALNHQTINRLNIQTLENEIAKLKQPFLHYVKKEDYENDKIWWNKRLDEMESKLSMKFYQNIGIYEKIRMEFSNQIADNMNKILKIKEDVKILLQKMS